MQLTYRSPSGDRGFTLVEALVALLVLAFGMLAIAGFQTTLSRNSDLAKQRTEAMRLGQQRIEALRSYGNVQADATMFDYTEVVSGNSTRTTNTTYNLVWTVTANAVDTEKWINMQVSWADRTGTTQSVQLLSVISKFDPSSIGSLATGPGGVNVRKPKNRNVNIPYPAVGLSGGTQSAFSPPPASGFYVFDNTTGNVVKSCSGTLPAEGGTLPPSGCSDVDARLLSGYVRFETSGGNPTASSVENASSTTLPLSSTTPMSFDFSNFTPSSPGNPTYTCYSQRQKTLRSNSTGAETTFPEAQSESGYSVTARFIAYACIVTPVDHDSSTATAKRWWGKVTIIPNTVSADGTTWSLGTTSSTYKVCRYSGDYNVNSAISNSEHPLWYRAVTGALDSQNFVVILGNKDCPTDVAAAPLANPADYVNTNTTDHQPTGELSFQCATSACTGANKTTLEPATTSTDLPME